MKNLALACTALCLALTACPRRVDTSEREPWPGGQGREPAAQGGTATTPEDRRVVTEPQPPLREAVPAVVGVAVPLSGKNEAWGKAVLAGVSLAIAEGGPHHVVARDTRGEPDGAARAIEELAAEGVTAIVGGVTNAEARSAAETAQRLGVPLVSLSKLEGIPSAGPFVFRTMLTAEAQAKALVEFAMGRRGHKRFAVMFPNVSYGQELAQAFWDDVEQRGGQITGAESYEPDRTTFSPLVKSLVGKANLDDRADYRELAQEIVKNEKDPYRRRKALEKLRERLPPVTDFDAVFIPDFARNVALIAPALAVEDVVSATCDAAEVERVRKATGRADLAPVQLLGANGWDDPDLVDRAGRYVQCSVFVDGFFAGSERPETKRFVDTFQARYGRVPSILEASAYDAAALIRTTSERGAASRDEVRRILQGIQLPGATGNISFDERREVVKPLFFLTVDGDGIRELRPEELAPPGAG
ncbi:MAG TPA: penicillin-binding protein activator [Anaeromyxobacteraceae bacterium]|nr:penicillin-binding protein activator [Anaeromyxobacteraceae bacterium]